LRLPLDEAHNGHQRCQNHLRKPEQHK
jgi:hypothetical protein